MKKLTVLALGGAAMLASIGGASAADVTRRPAPAYVPPPAAAAPVSAFNWNGTYVGLVGGYGWADFGASSTVSTGSGFLAGGYVGYNMQFQNNWVIGLEADALWSGIRGTSASNTADLNWLSTFRGRAGMAFDRFLVYGTGGLAVAGGELNDGGGAAKNTHFGWTIGAGVEMGITQNLVARAEYDYVNLNNKTYSSTGTYNTAPNANIFKVGLGFKF